MRRDWDLAREILRQVEENEGALGPGWIDLEIGDHPREEVSYHVMILAEANLLDAQNLTSHEGFDWRPKRLTSMGHEFLDAAREDSRWERAKRTVVEKTGSLSFAALQQVLFEMMKRSL